MARRAATIAGSVVILVAVLLFSWSVLTSPSTSPLLRGTTTTIVGLPPSFQRNPAWFSFAFQDVLTNKTFKISDFKGKVVIVEFMAVWCPLCRQQAAELLKVQSRFGNQTVLVSLDIDPNEKAPDLQAYANAVRANWLWALDRQGVGAQYNAQAPDTPILIIDADGNLWTTTPGIKSSSFLIDFIQKVLK